MPLTSPRKSIACPFTEDDDCLFLSGESAIYQLAIDEQWHPARVLEIECASLERAVDVMFGSIVQADNLIREPLPRYVHPGTRLPCEKPTPLYTPGPLPPRSFASTFLRPRAGDRLCPMAFLPWQDWRSPPRTSREPSKITRVVLLQRLRSSQCPREA